MKIAKPVAWVDPKYLPCQREGHTNVHLTLESRDMQRCALYTADQLAKAVAAEMERCAKVCEAAAPKGDYSILGNVGETLNRAAEAIRSAAK